MGIEIERKFLVTDSGWREAAGHRSRYRQGYLALTEQVSIRVRVELPNGRSWLGIKERRVGRVRGEFEYPVPPEDAGQLLALCRGQWVEKNRYHVLHVGHLWEVDEFLGENAGLVVAEIELKREDERFEPPKWLGREITDDERYYNAALALTPWSRWES